MSDKIIKAQFGNTPYPHTAQDTLKQIEDYIDEDNFLKPTSEHPNAAVEVPMDLDELRTLVSYVRGLEKKLEEQ
jgi:hypothetical protein